MISGTTSIRRTATRRNLGFNPVRDILSSRANDGLGIRFDVVDAIRLLFRLEERATVELSDPKNPVSVSWRPSGERDRDEDEDGGGEMIYFVDIERGDR